MRAVPDKPTYLPNPCTQDCPDRRAECVIGCEKYEAYEIDKFRRYAAQERERSAREYSDAQQRRKREHTMLRKEGRSHYGTK